MLTRRVYLCIIAAGLFLLAACDPGSPPPDLADSSNVANAKEGEGSAEQPEQPSELPKEAQYPYQINAELAKVYLKHGITDEAIRLFDLAITQQLKQTNTEDAENWIGLGDALKNANRTDEAVRCYQRALQILEQVLPNAQTTQQHNKIIERTAAVCAVLGLKDKRMEALAKLKADPDSVLQQLELAQVFRQIGNAEKAEAHYKRALELTSDDAKAAASVNVAYGELLFALERYDEALPMARAAAETEGADDKVRKAARRLLFELYEARGESDKFEFKD